MVTPSPGAAMRVHPGHFATVNARTEGGGYLTGCCCGWADLIDYAEVGTALASAAVHMMDPHLELPDTEPGRPCGCLSLQIPTGAQMIAPADTRLVA